jgi:hypothetical protein
VPSVKLKTRFVPVEVASEEIEAIPIPSFPKALIDVLIPSTSQHPSVLIVITGV